MNKTLTALYDSSYTPPQPFRPAYGRNSGSTRYRLTLKLLLR